MAVAYVGATRSPGSVHHSAGRHSWHLWLAAATSGSLPSHLPLRRVPGGPGTSIRVCDLPQLRAGFLPTSANALLTSRRGGLPDLSGNRL